MNKFIITGWKSRAMWPADADLCPSDYRFITDDNHQTEKMARAVAYMLTKDGFGGDGKIFPLATWIEPIIEEVKESPMKALNKLVDKNNCQEDKSLFTSYRF